MTVNELLDRLQIITDNGWGDYVILHSPQWAKVVEVTEINGPYTVVKADNRDNWLQLGSVPFFDDDDDGEKRKEWNKNHTIKSGLVLE